MALTCENLFFGGSWTRSGSGNKTSGLVLGVLFGPRRTICEGGDIRIYIHAHIRIHIHTYVCDIRLGRNMDIGLNEVTSKS